MIFLMATVMSLGTHELLKIHKKIIIFSAFQSGLGHQVEMKPRVSFRYFVMVRCVY